MQEVVFIVEEAQEGGFTAKCITESIFTQAETLEELKEAIIDAVHCHFDDDQKRIIRLQIVREEVIDA
jgi:predicted RNase H-like HicB family nuclease